MTTGVARASPRARLLVLAFGLSGASALVYEVVWLRWLTLVFGATTPAVSAVLAAFMAGLGVGSWLAGRALPRLARPLRAYGVLEIATGLFALGLPWLLSGIGPALHAAGIGDGSTPLTLGLARFVVVAALLLVPTACLGATFPLMVRAVRGQDDAQGGPGQGGAGWRVEQVGRLYAANLAGGVLGTLGAGFGLLPAIGLSRTNGIAAAASLGIGATALWLDRRWALGAAESSSGEEASRTPAPWSLPLVAASATAAGSGILAMVYEVAWSRALALVLGSSVYAFTIVLATVLAGLAGGSRLASRRPRALSPGLALGLAQIVVGLGALAGHAAMTVLPTAFVALFRLSGGEPSRLYPLEFLLAMAVVLVPAVGLGATLPLAIELGTAAAESVERTTARLYAANAIGAAVGGFAGGFLVLPAFGLRGTVVRAALIGVTGGGLLLLAFGGERRSLAHTAGLLGPLAGLALALAMPPWDLRVMTSGVAISAPTLVRLPKAVLGDALRSEQIVFYEEGLTTTVSVGLRDGVLGLRVDGKPDASTATSDMATQLLLAHLPLLFQSEPRETLVIGLGSGVTAGAALRHPVTRLTVVDLEPAVLRASRFFDEVSGAPLADPRVRVVIADVRSLLRLTRDRFDVVISEPSNPWMTVAASLFTRDFFEQVRDRLRPGGVFAQWLQLYRLSPDLLKSLVATYTAVFPHVAAFRTAGADLVLVGSTEPLAIDYPTLAGRMARPSVATSLTRVGVRDVGDLLARLVLDAEDAARFGAGARLNTEDNALVEFKAPRTLYLDSAPANLAALAAARAAGGSLRARILSTAPEGIREGLVRRIPGPPRP